MLNVPIIKYILYSLTSLGLALTLTIGAGAEMARPPEERSHWLWVMLCWAVAATYSEVKDIWGEYGWWSADELNFGEIAPRTNPNPNPHPSPSPNPNPNPSPDRSPNRSPNPDPNLSPHPRPARRREPISQRRPPRDHRARLRRAPAAQAHGGTAEARKAAAAAAEPGLRQLALPRPG